MPTFATDMIMSLLVDLLVAYFAVFIVLWCVRPLWKLRRVVDIVYKPLVWIGLRHGWTMFAPEVPDATRIVVAGAVFSDGEFEVIPLPGLADDSGFRKARDLRYITFQYKLGKANTDYLKPALCRYALDAWRSTATGDVGRTPVAIELREFAWLSPKPGTVGEMADNRTAADPMITTVWRSNVEG